MYDILIYICTCTVYTSNMYNREYEAMRAILLFPWQVHPNSAHCAGMTTRHYEFAGRVVGKCLYESCHGNRLLVSARFTRSFLAQIIGLRINYKVFWWCHSEVMIIYAAATVISDFMIIMTHWPLVMNIQWCHYDIIFLQHLYTRIWIFTNMRKW